MNLVPMNFYLIFIAVAVLMVVISIASAIARAHRRRELRGFASSQGWLFAAARDQRLRERFPELGCLNRGEPPRYAFNRMSGTTGDRRFLAFDYHYQESHTDKDGARHVRHVVFSAVMIASRVPLKPLLVHPASVIDCALGFLGKSRVEFESAEFNREFSVSSPDRRWAFDVIHPRTMEFLLGSPRYSIQFGDGVVLVWRSSTFSPREFAEALELGTGLFDRLPDYLLEQQRLTVS